MLKRVSFKDTEIGGQYNIFADITVSTYKEKFEFEVISIHDNTYEKKLYSLHHISPMTGLSNRHKAFGDITALTARGLNRDRFAVIMIELDDASNLRSLLGYAEMDKIIGSISNVLRDMSEKNKNIMVYHMHYVTFMIIYKEPSSPETIYNFLRDFRKAVQKAYSFKEKKRALKSFCRY